MVYWLIKNLKKSILKLWNWFTKPNNIEWPS